MRDETPGEVRRFAGNALWLLVGDAVAKLAGFVFLVLAARTLTQTDYGYFTFSLSFIPLFLVFSGWGLDDALFREVARSRERVSELFASTFIPRVALALAAVILAVGIGSFFVPGNEQLLALAIIGFALCLDELGSALGTVFKAFEQMRYRALRILVNRLVSTALAIVAVIMGADLLIICVTYLAGSLGSLIFAWVALRRYFPPISMRDRKRELIFDLMRKGLPLGISGVLGAAALRIDTVMLQGFKGPEAVALYGVAFRFLESFLFVAWGLSNVALPRMVRNEAAIAAQTFELVLSACFAFYLPLAVLGGFAGEWLVSTIFGAEYAPAGIAVLWLTTAGVFYGAGYLARMGCLSLGRRRAIAWAALIALLVNVPLNFVVIPRYGFEGAAAVTLVTGAIEAIALAVVFASGNRSVRLRPTLLVPFIAAGVMAATLAIGNFEEITAVLVGAIAYVLTFLVMAPLLAPKETSIALRALRRRPVTGAGTG
jgi:O-antigen/teichoic acid export membrane protein